MGHAPLANTNMADFYYKGKPYRFSSIQPKIADAQKRLPPLLGNTALNFFKRSWLRHGWLNKGLHRWQPRKGSKSWHDKGSRALLVKTGRLLNSIRLTLSGNVATIATNAPYAAAHNWGFRGKVNVEAHTRRRTGRASFSDLQSRKTCSRKYAYKTTVRAHSRNMNILQRQFMGNSEELESELMKMVEAEIERILAD